MKKLLTLLCAAAISAANAATLSETTGTTFAGLTAGDAFSASGAAAEGGKYYWYSADGQSGTNIALAANYGGVCGRPNMFANDSTLIALAVDADAPLYRTAEGAASAYTGTDFTQVDLGDGGLYIDTVVRFDLCRDTAEITDDGGKLAVWLDTSTNLVITAGKTENDEFSTNNYVIATLDGVAATFSPDVWYRLTVKAVTADNKISFNVYVDGKLAADGDGATDFPSLIPSATQLSALALQGVGSVDDISFTEALPNFLGVACIGDTYYESLDAAVSAAGANETITLTANNAENLTLAAEGKNFSIDTNGHTYSGTITAASEYALSSSTSAGVITYTQVAGVAACNGTWFATFTDAYNAALSAVGNAAMIVKLTNDFTPDISETYGHFYSLEFRDARADTSEGLTINLKNSAGTAYMNSSRYFFPANATLVLAADWSPWQTGLATGGTMMIPEGITVFVDCAANGFGYNYLSGLSGIAGAGTIKIGEHTYVGGHSDVYYIVGNPDNYLAPLLRNSAWQGTLELSGNCDWQNFALGNIGNANSKVRFNGFTTLLASTGHNAVGVELVGDGLTINSADASSRTYTIGGDVFGSGALTLADNAGTLLLSGDVSGFTGDVTVSGSSASVTFGASTAGSGQRIVVANGSSATIASAASWTAANVIVQGNLTVDGTLSVNDGCIWGNTGTGVIRFNNSSTALTTAKFASSWNGTYAIGWAGSNGTQIDFNSYATDKSKIEIPAGSTLQGYIEVRANNTLTNVVKELVVNGVLNLSNGYNYSTVVWKKISGSGTVKYAFNPSNWIKEQIMLLDCFTGSIEVSAHTQLTIGTINVGEMPTSVSCVVPMTVTSGGTVGGDLNLTVGGSATGKTLVYKADGADGAGLYLEATNPTIDGKEVDAAVVFDEAMSTNTITYPGEVTVATNEEGVVSVAYDNKSANVPEYYDVSVTTVGGNSEVTLSLNTNAVPAVGAGVDEDENLVEPMTVTPPNSEKPNGAVSLGVTTSNVKLRYGISYSTTPDGEYTKPDSLTPGTGSALKLERAIPGNNNVYYYRVYVTDIAPATP